MDNSFQVFKLIISVQALLYILLAGAARAGVLDAACEHVHMSACMHTPCAHAPCMCICSNLVARPDVVSDLNNAMRTSKLTVTWCSCLCGM